MTDDSTRESSGAKAATAVGRRAFLGGAGLAGAAAAASTLTASAPAVAQKADTPTPAPIPGYTYLKPSEAAFVEAVVDHMVPKDELTASGTDLGLAIYIDRALASGWGKGDRLYLDGPWPKGTPNQGYQLALSPAELYRAAIGACDAVCRKSYGHDFAGCTAEQKEAFLKDLQAGKITLDGGIPGRAFFAMLYENVMEGMFGDPVYGGNRDKAGWKLIGFPGVLANNAENVKKYGNGERFPAKPVGISDMS